MVNEYYQYIKDIFMFHHDHLGVSSEVAEGLYNSVPFHQVEKWLIKQGFDLNDQEWI